MDIDVHDCRHLLDLHLESVNRVRMILGAP
jgi:hypothetical protein